MLLSSPSESQLSSSSCLSFTLLLLPPLPLELPRSLTRAAMSFCSMSAIRLSSLLMRPASRSTPSSTLQNPEMLVLSWLVLVLVPLVGSGLALSPAPPITMPTRFFIRISTSSLVWLRSSDICCSAWTTLCADFLACWSTFLMFSAVAFFSSLCSLCSFCRVATTFAFSLSLLVSVLVMKSFKSASHFACRSSLVRFMSSNSPFKMFRFCSTWPNCTASPLSICEMRVLTSFKSAFSDNLAAFLLLILATTFSFFFIYFSTSSTTRWISTGFSSKSGRGSFNFFFRATFMRVCFVLGAVSAVPLRSVVHLLSCAACMLELVLCCILH
mmetsp:Transcript_22907/g.42765  ORF Transcript_22907/g.42765 Transcript_22907/m.42765 type:complete len:327 (+) Transcript_22907:555-1535(+)